MNLYDDIMEPAIEGTKDFMNDVSNEIINTAMDFDEVITDIRNIDSPAPARPNVDDDGNYIDPVTYDIEDDIANPSVPEQANGKQSDYRNDDGTLSEIDLNDFVRAHDNKLFEYDNYTWNFTLFATEMEDYNDYINNRNTNINRYIIARSGVTGRYSINTVKLQNTGPATPGITTNFSMYSMTVEIVENGGMKFADDIVTMSNRLRYRKFFDMPMILELNFIGYDEITGQPMQIPVTSKRYGVRINSVATQASRTGGQMIHTLSLVSMRSSINAAAWALGEAFQTNANTFGGFLDDLENMLDKKADTDSNYIKSILKFPNNKQVEILCSDRLRNMPITGGAGTTSQVDNTSAGSPGNKKFNWSARTAVSRVIDDVLDTATIIPEDRNGGIASNSSARQFVHVVPYSEFIGRDPVKNTLVYKQYYYIIAWKQGDVLHEDDLEPEKFNAQYFIENAEKLTDPETGTKKLNLKRYDYQFTGQNNEIINLDLKFNQQFNIAVSRNPQSLIDHNNTSGTYTPDVVKLNSKVYNLKNPALISQMERDFKELDYKVVEGTATPEEMEDAQSLSAMLDDEVYMRRLSEQQAEQEEEDYDEEPKDIYIEDYRDYVDPGLGDGINEMYNRVDGIPIDVSEPNLTKSGTEPDSDSLHMIDKKKTRDNYYHASFLQRLDMKVKGDPYWLIWSDYEYMEYTKQLTLGEEPGFFDDGTEGANFLTSEAYLLLNLRPPAQISDDTGLLDYTEPSVFAQSLYRVNVVQSVFSAEGFTQQINGNIVIRTLRRNPEERNQTDEPE